MNIQEATKLAMENGKYIYRASKFDEGSQIVFIPTNTHGYIIYSNYGKAFTPMWQPMAEDLLADDWIVVGMSN